MTIGRGNSLHSEYMGEQPLGSGGDPMDSMGNLMDVMLVFACGLMVALVAHYNVDLNASPDLNGNVEELNDPLEQVAEDIDDGSSAYSEVGTVYRDADTGQLYVVTREGEELPTGGSEPASAAQGGDAPAPGKDGD